MRLNAAHVALSIEWFHVENGLICLLLSFILFRLPACLLLFECVNLAARYSATYYHDVMMS